MSLQKCVQVNTKYTRSTNLERDRGSLEIVKGYLPTSRGAKLLSAVADACSDEDMPRAWSLIGPYGSGKSSFALFLSELLAGSSSGSHKAAVRVLGREHKALAKQFAGQPSWCRVTLTGSAEPLGKRLLSAVYEAAANHWAERKGRKPKVLADLKAATEQENPSTSEILSLVSAVQEALLRTNAGGLVLVIDELGKFLEYEARHYGANDIFLLQGLAELAYRGSKANLLLFVLLHQSFDLYARGLGESLKNDWAKVQGRFQNVPFVETTEQTLRIVDTAITHKLTKGQHDKIAQSARRIAETLEKAKALPGILDVDRAATLFAGCYPIHPVALIALPVLCQKFAQNERTLFSYLGSQEPHGFQSSLEDMAAVGEWLHPSAVFDYFIQNQPAILADPLAHRRWAEVVTAVERSDQLPTDAQQLTKAIGLLNLIASNEGMRPSLAVLSSLYESEAKCKRVLDRLSKTSIIQYRKFSNEYRVWQGTDFDLDEHVEQEEQKLGKFDLAPMLSERAPTEPVMARRHSVQYGVVRYFEIEYLDARSAPKYSPDHSAPRMVIFLAEGQEDERIFHEQVKPRLADQDIGTLYKNGTEVRAAIKEVLALEAVQRGAQELASDPVAARELKERLSAAKVAEWNILRTVIGSPSYSEWFWQGSKVKVANARDLQRAASKVMDAVYAGSPLIQNELINRDRLSSQAAAARNKLLQAMLERSGEATLGIEKYPPEKAIYRSIFEKGKLHRRKKGSWGFVRPDTTCPLSLNRIWRAFDAFFESTEHGRRTIAELQEQLQSPPFGLKHGIFPILLVHYYLVNGHEVALYEENAYVPSLTFEHIERIIRRPEAYAFQRFRIEGVRASLFEQYRRALFGDTDREVDVLGIARPLTSFMLGLEDYTKKTRNLTKTTLAIREAFFLSKSPEKLLLEELPKASGLKDMEQGDGFADTLLSALRELKSAYPDLLDSMRGAICEAFGVARSTPLEELRPILRGRCHGLDQYTVDVKGLKSFIRRISDKDASEDGWLTGLLLFLGHKPSQKWTDQDRDAATYRLAEFSRRLLDLEKLRLHYDSASRKASELDVVMIKVLRRGSQELDEIISLTEKSQRATKESRQQIEQILDGLGDNELRLALVAELAHDFLRRYRNSLLREDREVNEVGAVFDVK